MLLGLPEAELSDIKTVYSHNQALMQCSEYLNSHEGWTQVSALNTAVAAKKVMEDEVKTLLTESYHYNGIDIDNADKSGDFTIEHYDERFFISENCDDYYEKFTIEEKEIV